ncbi:MAG: hypothetical protein MK066_00530 [Crocinitomicaceae bacterium]|nr:hypothetical protein [Crocinitomicaceae bacterium]
MIKSIIIVLMCLLGGFASAQYNSKVGTEGSQFRPGFMWYFTGLRPAKVDRVRKYDRLIFDITYNDWIGDRDLFQNHWASIGLNTNFMFDVPLRDGNTVALGIGVAHSFSVIRHNGNLIQDEILGTTAWTDKLPLQNYKRSTFGAHSFAMPLELRFRKESWRHFKFHIGGRIGYQTSAFNKEVEGEFQNKEINKVFGFVDNEKLIYGAHLRFGFRNWALFANYNFNKVFSNTKSVQLNQTQLGISISLF